MEKWELVSKNGLLEHVTSWDSDVSFSGMSRHAVDKEDTCYWRNVGAWRLPWGGSYTMAQSLLEVGISEALRLCVGRWVMSNCSPPDSSARGILQARILEWVAISFSRGFSQLRDRTWVSCIADRFFSFWEGSGARMTDASSNTEGGKLKGSGGWGFVFTFEEDKDK